MKRIAFIAHLSEVSGAGVALLDTAAAFQKTGYDIWFILPGSGDLGQRASDRGVVATVIANEERSMGEARGIAKFGMAAGRARYVRRLAAFLKSCRVEVAYVNSSASIFAGIAARLAGVPIVWHIHETLDCDDRRSRAKKWIIRQLADGIVYASQSAREAFPPGDLPSMIARNAVDIAGLSKIRTARESASAGGAAILLLNGTIRRKGADVFLRAVHKLRVRGWAGAAAMRVVITGSPETDPVFYAELESLVEELQLGEMTQLAGLQGSLAPLLAEAAVYVSASRNEAMPIAIVEAMAAGVPVVATDVGDCAELLENGRCGWVVPPEDAEALAAAISKALGDVAEAERRAAAAAVKVDRLYGGDDFWEPLFGFVERVARGGRSLGG